MPGLDLSLALLYILNILQCQTLSQTDLVCSIGLHFDFDDLEGVDDDGLGDAGSEAGDHEGLERDLSSHQFNQECLKRTFNWIVRQSSMVIFKHQ